VVSIPVRRLFNLQFLSFLSFTTVTRFLFFSILTPVTHSYLQRSMHLPTLLAAFAVPVTVLAQLSGKVGPLTTHASKSAKKTCNVLSYGAKADKSTDIGPALLKAFAACKTGGTVVVPSGDYAMKTWATFEGGKAWALQLDGVIYRTGTDAGNMLFVRNANDFEMFSSTGKGAVQGTSSIFQAQFPLSRYR
jgi:hypothetical protein